MKKKTKTKRAVKPRPLKSGSLTIASVRPSITGASRLVDIQWPTFNVVGARRLNEWLTRAIAWCEDGRVRR